MDKRRVMTLIQGGQWSKAKQACSDLCLVRPNDAEAWFYLAGINAQLGAMEEVVGCCLKVVAIQPSNVAAYYNLGVALQSQNRHEEAEEAYRHVLLRDPGHALSHANLGLALRELNRPEEAIASCREALRLKPDLAEAGNTLGLLYKDRKGFAEALSCFKLAIKQRPVYAEAHYNLGLCHEALNDTEAAAQCFREAIRLRPGYAEAHGHLGHIFAAAGELSKATSHYARAIEAKPDYVDALNGLGNALLDQENFRDNYAEAEKCYRESLRYRPDIPEIHMNLALALQDQAKYEEAEAHYHRALELKPDYEDAVAGLATLLERKGEFAASDAVLRPLVEKGTNNINVANAYAAVARHVDRRQDAVTLLEHCVGNATVARQRMEAFFSLGKLFDEMRDPEKAFDYYRQANSLEAGRFDAKQTERDFDQLMTVFSRSGMATMPRASNHSRLPVFIVGMPRSGTSLVEQILASHPEVYGAGELGDIHKITTLLPGMISPAAPYPQCVGSLGKKSLDQTAQAHLERLMEFSPTARRVTDKMPHNFLGLGLIDMLFPAARVIHIMRSPMDNCLSIYFQHFNTFHPYASDLADLGVYYRQYLRLMAHWRETLRIPMLEIQYENLVENQEKISRELIEFCGLEWDDRCLNFHETKRVTKTISYDQVRRPMYKKSVARWRAYQAHLEPLAAALGDAADRQE